MADTHCLIAVPASDTGNGSLAMFQHQGIKSIVPFPIKKVLIVSGMKPGDERGKHAHHETQEIIFPIEGGCEVEIDDGKKKQVVQLRGKSQALLLPARVWRTLRKFDEKTILLIIADQEYDERDYIRSYEEFLSVLAE